MKTVCTRRTVLQLGGAYATVGLLAAPRFLEDDEDGRASVARRLTALFSDRQSAAAVGDRFFKVSGEENNWKALLEGMFADHADKRIALQNLSGEELRRCVAAMVSQDFARRNVLQLDGWVLSRTEVRLYALSSLTA